MRTTKVTLRFQRTSTSQEWQNPKSRSPIAGVAVSPATTGIGLRIGSFHARLKCAVFPILNGINCEDIRLNRPLIGWENFRSSVISRSRLGEQPRRLNGLSSSGSSPCGDPCVSVLNQILRSTKEDFHFSRRAEPEEPKSYSRRGRFPGHDRDRAEDRKFSCPPKTCRVPHSHALVCTDFSIHKVPRRMGNPLNLTV